MISCLTPLISTSPTCLRQQSTSPLFFPFFLPVEAALLLTFSPLVLPPTSLPSSALLSAISSSSFIYISLPYRHEASPDIVLFQALCFFSPCLISFEDLSLIPKPCLILIRVNRSLTHKPSILIGFIIYEFADLSMPAVRKFFSRK